MIPDCLALEPSPYLPAILPVSLPIKRRVVFGKYSGCVSVEAKEEAWLEVGEGISYSVMNGTPPPKDIPNTKKK